MNSKVDVILGKAKKWREELQELRRIILGCGLTEEVKWGSPCYTFENANVIVIGGFKESCVISFFKGALLKDAEGLLTKPGQNTQSVRVIRFRNVREIVEREPILKAYIREAMAVEKAGLKVSLKKNPEPVPAELRRKLEAMPALKTAFEALTPGRRRAYILYFSAAKQSGTREARIEKCVPRILKGRGLND
jgi:uncharacterized protein YdeI (YjbR/CyaY-like superfamily)